MLVNNAGIAFKKASTASPLEQATATIETNFKGTLNMFRAFAPVMAASGKIVNVSSYHPGETPELPHE